jgi:ubiquinol-cytochrome c reductase cytochrome c1 subunit
MKKIRMIVVIVGLFIAAWLHASLLQSPRLLPVDIDLSDREKLQRGARLYMNYCSGCHSLRYMRYNRMAKDLGLTTFSGELDEELLFNNLIVTHAKIDDPIEISMPATDARQWFGVVPPDLTLAARKRGADWLYTYLESFYEDTSKPFGSNNLLFPDVAMPAVLAPLTGRVVVVTTDQAGRPLDVPWLMHMGQGEMSMQEFDMAMQDLVTFLVYVAEPVKLVRYRMGTFVILFLCVFSIVAWKLKKSYWKRLEQSA